ncbi:MAG: hypothetical protein ACREKN_00515 [Longimicrobiaceae bacterium]
MLIQEVQTELPAKEVIRRAKEFFLLRFSPYAGFVSSESDSHVKFAVEVGSLSIGTGRRDGKTVVRGSTSRLHHELSQFLGTLAHPEKVRQNVIGPGVSGAG